MIYKDEVVAHVIMEQTSEPCAVNVRDYSRNGLLYVIFETIFQSFTGNKLNLSTRMNDILNWSDSMFNSMIEGE